MGDSGKEKNVVTVRLVVTVNGEEVPFEADGTTPGDPGGLIDGLVNAVAGQVTRERMKDLWREPKSGGERPRLRGNW